MPPEDTQAQDGVLEKEELPVEEQPEEILEQEGEVEEPAGAEEVVEESDDSPTAEELRAQIAEQEAELERLRAEKEEAPATEAKPEPTPRARVTDYLINQHLPQASRQYAETVKVDKESGEISIDAAKQFEVMADTAYRMIGARMADEVTPHIQQLAVSNITLANELAIRDLRSEPDFAKHEADVRKQLSKTDWKTRAGESAVHDIFYKLRGSKRLTTAAPAPKAKTAPAARTALKDIVGGGNGAPSKPSTVRLSPEQKADYTEMIENGWVGTETDYLAKYKARVDQAKAQGKPIPRTYRG